MWFLFQQNGKRQAQIFSGWVYKLKYDALLEQNQRNKKKRRRASLEAVQVSRYNTKDTHGVTKNCPECQKRFSIGGTEEFEKAAELEIDLAPMAYKRIRLDEVILGVEK